MGKYIAMPYAILSDSLPADKMGTYMGIFNFFITIPQITNGIFMDGLYVMFIMGMPCSLC